MSYAAREYARAASPEPFRILGITLKPLSLHHCQLMQLFGVAFTSQEETPGTLEDLIFAILICSKHWNEREFEEYVFSEDCAKDVTKWSEQIGKECAEAGELFDVNSRIKLFSDYIKRHSEEPAYWRTESADAKQSGAHWAQCVLLTLTSHCGYTRSEALHCSLSQALSDYFRHAEAQGLIQLMPETPEEQLQKLERELAAGKEASV